MTDVLGQTTFVTLFVSQFTAWKLAHRPCRYQAGEGIYDLFDKVMVLDHGRQVYFGPPSAARGYFESLGFRSVDCLFCRFVGLTLSSVPYHASRHPTT